MNLDKLEELIKDRYKLLRSEALDDQEFFVNWCDKHKIVMVHPEWVKDEFNTPHRNMVCVMSPENTKDSCPWLLVPKRLAEKALVLGHLP